MILTSDDNIAAVQFNLGLMLVRKGMGGDALEHFARALEVDAALADAVNDIGALLQDRGERDVAEQYYRLVLEHVPTMARACNNLATALKDQGRVDDSIAWFTRALEIDPSYGVAYGNLAAALEEQERPAEAKAVLEKALNIAPDDSYNLHRLGRILKMQNQFQEAMGYYRRSFSLNPDNAPLLNDMASLHLKLGDKDAAADCINRALACDPDYAATHLSLGALQRDLGRLEESAGSYRSALELDPSCPQALIGLISILKDLGQIGEAVACLRRLTDLAPDNEQIHLNLIYFMHFLKEVTPAEIFAEHLRWGEKFTGGVVPCATFSNLPDRARRLRIGYVSPDFRSHAVNFLFEPVLSCHDRAAFEIFCYAGVTHPDATTERLQGMADHWRDISGLNDDDAAAIIRRDCVDILVDLAGHTEGSRVKVFARKPAPVQVEWLGYFNTSGLAAMDYIISDPVTSPDERQPFTETVVRMPFSRFCYSVAPDTPPCSDLPSDSNGFITFGCFNNTAKLNTDVFHCWGEIMGGLPNSRLVLKWVTLDDAAVRDHLRRLLSRHGIDVERVDFHGRCSQRETLEKYALVDISLDPFPFPGGLNTLESLWMGVPVVTMAGTTFIGRQGTGLVTTIGRPEWVARSVEEYKQIALGLAGDVARLRQLRRTLRSAMEASPLMDAARFTSDLERLYRQMWQQWCDRQGECL
jgi:protein O-GlcNAc transferase